MKLELAVLKRPVASCGESAKMKELFLHFMVRSLSPLLAAGCLKEGAGMMRATATVLVSAVLFWGMSVTAFTSDCSALDREPRLSRALREVRLFSGLTEADRAALKTVAALRRGEAGERIIEQGKPLDRMFIVLQAQVEIRVNGTPVSVFPRQALVGEMEFLDGLPAAADVILLGDSDVIELSYPALTDLMARQPRLGYVLMRKIAGIEARRLRKSTQQ